jgi:hypothetical protein
MKINQLLVNEQELDEMPSWQQVKQFGNRTGQALTGAGNLAAKGLRGAGKLAAQGVVGAGKAAGQAVGGAVQGYKDARNQGTQINPNGPQQGGNAGGDVNSKIANLEQRIQQLEAQIAGRKAA